MTRRSQSWCNIWGRFSTMHQGYMHGSAHLKSRRTAHLLTSLLGNLPIGNLFWKNSGTDNEVGRAAELISNRESTLQESLPNLLLRFGKPLSQGGFPTNAYVAFSNRDYWKRIWIIQEVYQARNLDFVCGDASLPSNLLAGAITLIEMFKKKHIISDQASVPSTQTPQGQLLHKFALAIPPLPPMNRLMVYTSIYPQEVISLRVAMTNFYVKERLFGPQATDPRDVVCGLLGFSTLYEKLYIMADYSIPVRESYIAVTQALISHGFTDVLAWAQAETKCIEGLPSWVPDFSATILPSLCSHGQAKPWFPCFGASG